MPGGKLVWMPVISFCLSKSCRNLVMSLLFKRSTSRKWDEWMQRFHSKGLSDMLRSSILSCFFNALENRVLFRWKESIKTKENKSCPWVRISSPRPAIQRSGRFREIFSVALSVILLFSYHPWEHSTYAAWISRLTYWHSPWWSDTSSSSECRYLTHKNKVRPFLVVTVRKKHHLPD